MTEQKANYIKRMKIKQIHFAWDRYEDKDIIIPKFKMFKEITKWDRRKMSVYVLTNFNTTFEQDLERVYTLTPMIIKTEKGYWKEAISFAEFEQRLKVNLIKKWNAYHNEKIDENFDLYTMIELKNKKPIAMEYKNIKLLGDKVQIQVADNKRAQDLWYFALGVGLGEMNARGCGFLNYRWL